jgi:hypothetical protein
MKSDTTTTVLNFALVLLAVCGVIFAILTFARTREFRLLSSQATVDKDLMMRVEALGSEVNAYNQKNPSPELTRILQPGQAKPAATK